MLSISTNWNSRRHETGEALLDEIAGFGLSSVELGYALTARQTDGIRARFREGSVRVSSVHAFSACSIPGMTHATPEPYSLCLPPRSFRYPLGPLPAAIARAEEAVLEVGRLAASFEAKRVVLHAGRIPVHSEAVKIESLLRAGKRRTPAYEQALRKLLARRDRLAPPRLDALRASLDRLLPEYEHLGVTLCLENLPTGDGCPNEPEMLALLNEFDGAPLAAWHDLGHGQIRHEMGLIHHAGILKRLAGHIGGFHVHDVTPGFYDHHMPPGGLVDFRPFAPYVQSETPLVLEPAPGLEPEKLASGLDYLRHLWETSVPEKPLKEPR